MIALPDPLPTRRYGLDPLPARCSECGSLAVAVEPPYSGSEPGRVVCSYCGRQACWLIEGPTPLRRLPSSESLFARRLSCSVLCTALRGHDAETHETAGYRIGRADPENHRNCIRPQTLSLRGVVQVGPLSIDATHQRVSLDCAPLRLSPIEARLLSALAMRVNGVVLIRELFEAIWSSAAYDATTNPAHQIRVHMTRLRGKLGAHRHLIETAKGVGYRLVTPP